MRDIPYCRVLLATKMVAFMCFVSLRWRRVDQETLELHLTFDDPIAYTKPWTGQRLFGLKPDWEIQEEVFCEDRGMLNSPAYIQMVP